MSVSELSATNRNSTAGSEAEKTFRIPDSAIADGECDDCVLTSLFSVGKGEFAGILSSRFGLKWWFILIGLLTVGAIAGAATSDLRWIIVALMLVLLVVPMVGAMLYFNYGLRRECYMNIAPHKVAISSSGLRVDVYILKSAEDEEADDGAKAKAASRDEKVVDRIYSIDFPPERLGRYTVGSKGITLSVEAPGAGFVRLPYSAFADEKVFAKAIEIIRGFNTLGNGEKVGRK